MKYRSLIIALVLSSVVLASCQDYAKLAEERTLPPYPNYFGAAGEFQHAADCYYSIGEEALAKEYYAKAAEYYTVAVTQLVEGGDNYLRGKSYELAGDSYYKAGMISQAIQAYNKSFTVFSSNGYDAEAQQVMKKLEALTKRVDLSPYVGLISLTALFFSLFSLVYVWSYSRKNQQPLVIEKKIIKREVVEKPIKKIEFKKKEEVPVKKREVMSPKEKLAKKLREKYMPK